MYTKLWRKRLACLFVSRFNEGRGLMLSLHQTLDALDSLHRQLSDAVQQLRSAPADRQQLATAVDCCLRLQDPPLAVCVFCAVHKIFEEYEGKLYCFSDKGQSSAPGAELVEALGQSSDSAP